MTETFLCLLSRVVLKPKDRTVALAWFIHDHYHQQLFVLKLGSKETLLMNCLGL